MQNYTHVQTSINFTISKSNALNCLQDTFNNTTSYFNLCKCRDWFSYKRKFEVTLFN